MIYKLKDAKIAEDLFKDWREGCIWSCLQNIMGNVYADDMETPGSAMAVLGGYCYLAGKPNTEFLKYNPEDCKNDNMAFVPQNKQWSELIEKEYGNKAVKKIRYEMKKEKDIFDETKLKKIADGLSLEYQLKPIDKDLYEAALKEEWSSDFVSNYDTYEFYKNKGFGVAVIKDRELVAGASSYCSFDGGIEVVIATKEEYRRRGLASVCASKLILECLKRDLCPSWDAAVMRSRKLAEKLGYHLDYEYDAYEIKRKLRGDIAMSKASYMELSFEMFFEPESGINTPKEFTDELLAWAKKENKDITILEESMEPKIELKGIQYICRLGSPNVAAQNNLLWKKLGFKGINQSVGKYLGYKWVYLYKI